MRHKAGGSNSESDSNSNGDGNSEGISNLSYVIVILKEYGCE